jgi:hypothetical protein
MADPLTYSLEDAAGRLGGPFTVDWLKGHLAEIPHIRAGKGRGRSGRVGFSEKHLEQIVAMFSIDPLPGTKPGDFTPLTRRRRAS